MLRGDFKADRLTHLDEDAVGQIRYLERYASCPAYTNTRTEYFPVGDLAFVRMLEELEKAERYIFLEYFILQEGSAGTPSWTSWSGRPPPGWRCG